MPTKTGHYTHEEAIESERRWDLRNIEATFNAERTELELRAGLAREAADKSAANRDNAIERAGKVVVGGAGTLTDAEFQQYERNMDAALRHEQRAQLADTVAKRAEKKLRFDARVAGVGTYRENGPHSFFKDHGVIAAGASTPTIAGLGAAKQRMAQYVKEQASWTGDDAAYLRKATNDSVFGRNEQEVQGRAMSPALGQGGELIVPAYLIQKTAIFRASLSSFANACDHSISLPAYGLVLQIPSLTGPASTASQTANTGVSETDPTTGYLDGGSRPFYNVNIELLTGQAEISLQAIERSSDAQGGALDTIIFKALTESLVQQVDAFAITQALTALAGTITDNVAYSLPDFWVDLSQARQAVSTSAGVAYRATHLFGDSRQVDRLVEAVDDDHRPVFQPDFATVSNKDDADTGINIQSLSVWVDDNIPNAGSNAQWLVSRPDTVLLAEGTPIPSVFVEPLADSLSCLLNLREYAACVPRWAATANITGSAFAAASGA